MNPYLLIGIVLVVYMTLWFVVALVKKRNDVADVAWGLGFVLVSWLSYLLIESPDVRSLLVVVLVTIWGLRLAWHIHVRNRGRSEDPRYRAWREAWGSWFFIRSYLQVFILQGALLFAIATPVFALHRSAGVSLGILDLVGLMIWVIGFIFEAVGDAQLARFIRTKENAGKVLDTGLWRYSRHPNYFGEVTQWWGIWVIALSAPLTFWSIIGPLTITFLILKVSGIPMLEKRMSENSLFRDYQARTSVFFPLPPRRIPSTRENA